MSAAPRPEGQGRRPFAVRVVRLPPPAVDPRTLGAMGERLEPLEAALVHVEEPHLPMHVGGLGILGPRGRAGGPLRVGELRVRLRRRLDTLPRLRRRLMEFPFAACPPAWGTARPVDVRDHLGYAALPPGAGWEDVLALVGELHAAPLPRDRPLWRMTLIDGVPGGRQALLTKIHHAVADGIAGVEVTRAFLDHDASRAGPRPAPTAAFFGASRSDGAARLMRAAVGAGRYLAGGPIAAAGPFNGRVGRRRAVVTADLSLGRVKAVKEHLGGSVDDVVLAIVALALGAYLRGRGGDTDGGTLRAMVPVSTRAGEDGLGDRVTATFIDLPVGLAPIPCLHRIAAAKALHRMWHEPLGVLAGLDALGLLPAPTAAAVCRAFAGLRFANVIVSDVPGPPKQLRLLGAPMVAAYPLMPLTASVGLSIAVLTIGDAMSVGITTDPDVVPEGGALGADVERALADLECAYRPLVRT